MQSLYESFAKKKVSEMTEEIFTVDITRKNVSFLMRFVLIFVELCGNTFLECIYHHDPTEVFAKQ